MKFWIVTPSYNQLAWLKLCVASVADQGNDDIEVYHHIQDARSSDGTPEWLESVSAQKSPNPKYHLSFESKEDGGMYDAINKGWKLAPDEINVVSHLNCDEQYVQGGLDKIASYFDIHTTVDVVLADMLVVDDQGQYICHRRSLRPYKMISKYTCGGFTATTFHRLSVTRNKNLFFDTSWKNIGDRVWYNSLHTSGCKIREYNQIVSVFTDTGENLNWTEQGQLERNRYATEFLGGRSFGNLFFSRVNGFRRFIKEFWVKAPNSYSIFLPDLHGRITREIKKPTGLWHKKIRSH